MGELLKPKFNPRCYADKTTHTGFKQSKLTRQITLPIVRTPWFAHYFIHKKKFIVFQDNIVIAISTATDFDTEENVKCLCDHVNNSTLLAKKKKPKSWKVT
jgi:hypothetical protein